MFHLSIFISIITIGKYWLSIFLSKFSSLGISRFAKTVVKLKENVARVSNKVFSHLWQLQNGKKLGKKKRLQ